MLAHVGSILVPSWLKMAYLGSILALRCPTWPNIAQHSPNINPTEPQDSSNLEAP